MATDDDVNFLESILNVISEMPEEEFPQWEDASDLARLHAQAFATEVTGGTEYAPSRGTLRITGDGVRGHSLDLDVAGQLLSDWQHLVTSAGASSRNKKAIAGRLPAEIVRGTKLSLTAPALPGSLVLEFGPTRSEVNDRAVDLLGDKGDPLVAQSVRLAMDVVALATDAGDFKAVRARLKELGPRVASAALQLAEDASEALLDLNLVWEEPGLPRRRSVATASQLRAFASGLKVAGLDADPLVLRGTLRTVSDKKKIDLEVDDETQTAGKRHVSIARGDVDFREYRVGERVDVTVEVKITLKPGGTEKRSYRAVSVESK